MSELLRLSFRELGARLGITHDGARFLAKRRGWRVVKGNDGKAAVLVPETELAAEVERASADDRPSAEQERDELRARLKVAEARADALQAELEKAQAALAHAEARAGGLQAVVERLAALEQGQATVMGLLRRLRWIR